MPGLTRWGPVAELLANVPGVLVEIVDGKVGLVHHKMYAAHVVEKPGLRRASRDHEAPHVTSCRSFNERLTNILTT